MALILNSSAIEAGGTIPEKYTCEGEDISPPLSWQGVPSDAKSLVLIMDDPDAPNGTWSHWVLYNLPPSLSELPENYPSGGKPEPGGMQGRNDFGDVQYGGPCPPPGSTHTYHFRLYAVDRELTMSAGATRQQVLDRIQDHIIDNTELMADFGR